MDFDFRFDNPPKTPNELREMFDGIVKGLGIQSDEIFPQFTEEEKQEVLAMSTMGLPELEELPEAAKLMRIDEISTWIAKEYGGRLTELCEKYKKNVFDNMSAEQIDTLLEAFTTETNPISKEIYERSYEVIKSGGTFQEL